MSVLGRYYLHTNSELIYKPDPEAAADIRDSDFARAMWPIDPTDRAGAWTLLVEAGVAGAKATRIAELAAKWGCNDEDAAIYAARVDCVLKRDGSAWCAHRQDFVDVQASPAGFGGTALQAMAELCKALGYAPSTMWPDCFERLLTRPEPPRSAA